MELESFIKDWQPLFVLDEESRQYAASYNWLLNKKGLVDAQIPKNLKSQIHLALYVPYCSIPDRKVCWARISSWGFELDTTDYWARAATSSQELTPFFATWHPMMSNGEKFAL